MTNVHTINDIHAEQSRVLFDDLYSSSKASSLQKLIAEQHKIFESLLTLLHFQNL